MTTILLIIQILVAVALVAVVLMQRSEGGALGIGGGPGGMMTGRSAANLLTRTTMILGVVFMANSIALAALTALDQTGRSVIDRVGTQDQRGPLPFDFDEDEVAEPVTGETAADQPEAEPTPAQTEEPAPDQTEEPGR